MAQWLSDLGRLCVYRATTVLLAWGMILLGLGSLIAWSGPQLSNDFTIPGTQAQEGLDTLAQRFPEMNGVTGQLLLSSTDGTSIDRYKQSIEEYLNSTREKLPPGSSLTSPWSEYLRAPAVSEDGTHALVTIQFPFTLDDIDEETRGLLEALSLNPPEGITASPGGQIYQTTSVPLSMMEVVGVGVAFLTLFLTLRSFRAAITPLLTALIGTAGIVVLIVLSALWLDISTTTPTLAVMISLAVGIDYALFIVTRHQRQMRTGISPLVSIPLANATAGSAVIYAAATVVVALSALAVTGIPFLTTMGISAAAGVVIAAISAVTALPALLAVVGKGILPRQRTVNAGQQQESNPTTKTLPCGSPPPEERPQDTSPEQAARRTLPERWAQGVTRHPILALLGVLVAVFALALPAPVLRLGLPDNGVEAPGTYARDTYDTIERAFGPGANAPLLIIGDIIHSTDPLTLMDRWAQEVETIPGVASVQLATPNRNADLGVVVAIPTSSSTDPATANTVEVLRLHASEWAQHYGIENVRVTGLTAAKIDITDRLSAALIPFSIVVVALALIILTFVFHSIWVPLSAAFGYLLSAAAAFGVTAAVFRWQTLNELLLIGQTGPVICFMPIIVVGVLFGLAMDYQVFVVTAIQEEWLKGSSTQQSIIRGMRHSGSVVAAAAVIMVAVFAGFIPHGSFYVQPIAVGLAVGVAVDAFLIRMTAIPAFLALVGRHAWWCPPFLAERLPHLSHGEGALVDELPAALDDSSSTPLLIARGLVVDNPAGHPLRLADFDIHAGECVQIDATPLLARQVLRILAGTSKPRRGYFMMNLIDPGKHHSPKRARVGFIYDSVSADLVVKDIRKSHSLPCLAVDVPLDEDDLRTLYAASAERGGCLLIGPLADLPQGLTVRVLRLLGPPASTTPVLPTMEVKA